MRRKCLVVIPMKESQKKRFLEGAKNWEVKFVSSSDVKVEEVKEAEIILGNVSPALISL